MNRSKRKLFFKNTGIIFFIFLILAGLGCSKNADEDNGSSPTPSDPLLITVDTETQYQTISGFGGANRMWGTAFLQPSEFAKTFGTGDSQLGLSIFRIRIPSDTAEWSNVLTAAQGAQQYGVKIIACPWSPPAALKSNNSDIGGYLLPENYGAFKDHLNSFIQYMADNGVSIYAVSVQNEPDIQVSYESCDWSTPQMVDFVKNYGGQIMGAQLAAPESFHFDANFTNALLNDADAAENFEMVAGHIYGGGLGEFPLAEQQGKEIWMTEYLMNLNTGSSGAPAWQSYTESAKWEETLSMLSSVHEAMTYRWNAYVWWYLQRYYSFIGDGEQGTTNGAILKRGYAFSHFSRFVRPGYIRVKTDTNKSNSLKITAYSSNQKIVVVIVNDQSFTGKIAVSAADVTAATAVTTTTSVSMQSTEVTLIDAVATLSIVPKSVTTVVLDK